MFALGHDPSKFCSSWTASRLSTAGSTDWVSSIQIRDFTRSDHLSSERSSGIRHRGCWDSSLCRSYSCSTKKPNSFALMYGPYIQHRNYGTIPTAPKNRVNALTLVGVQWISHALSICYGFNLAPISHHTLEKRNLSSVFSRPYRLFSPYRLEDSLFGETERSFGVRAACCRFPLRKLACENPNHRLNPHASYQGTFLPARIPPESRLLVPDRFPASKLAG